MVNYNDSLKKVDDILNWKCNDEFLEIYSFTTENIKEYLKYFEMNNKKILTVGSSGDQVLNSYLLGAKDITLLDINELSKYYLNLKIAAIYSLTYEEFQKFFFKYYDNPFNYNECRFSKELFKKLKNNLKSIDYESYMFFSEVFKMYNVMKLQDYLFDDDESRKKVITGTNNYLSDEESYNKLKKIISDISFKFINIDIFDYKTDERFDNIFLSNLCTYYNFDKLKKLLDKLIKNNLNIDGNILFAYLWNTNFNDNEYEESWKDIYKMPLVKEYFKDYITAYNIRGVKDVLWDEDKKRDLILVYRKKV